MFYFSNFQLLKKKPPHKPTFSELRMKQAEHKAPGGYLKDALMILLGIASATFGLKGFLLPNGFLDGGITGISLLVNIKTGVGLSFLIILFNIPFVVLGYTQISRGFAAKTLVAITTLSVCVHLIDIEPITNDKLLISVFGGFFLGAGIGFSIRGGSVIDGTEVLALYISRNSVFTVGDVITLLNVFIFLVSAITISVETALYAMLTYLAASKTVDFIVQGFEEYTGVTIVTKKSNEISKAIVEITGAGVTVYKGDRGYGKRGHTESINVVFVVITRLEVTKIKTIARNIDEEAFIVMHTINDLDGGIIKKRPLH